MKQDRRPKELKVGSSYNGSKWTLPEQAEYPELL